MKTKTKLIMIAITAIIVCAIVACALMFIGKTVHTVDLNNYVVITETGREGYGDISLSIDFDKLLYNYSTRLTDENLEELGFSNMSAQEAAKSIIDNENPYLVGYVIDGHLKNDDVVELTWKVNRDAIDRLSKILNVTIEYSNFEYIMHNLQPVKEVDLFADVRIQYWGTNGNGSINPFPEAFVTIEETGNVLSFPLTITVENDGNLSNGDIVHMSLNENVNLDHLLNTYGIVFTRTEADIVLDGFAE